MAGETEHVRRLIGLGFRNAAIIDLDRNVKATSEGFEVRENEATKIVEALGPIVIPGAFSNGITVNGVTYTDIDSTPIGAGVYGKNGTEGVVLERGGNLIVIGVYDERLQLDRAAEEVVNLARFVSDF